MKFGANAKAEAGRSRKETAKLEAARKEAALKDAQESLKWSEGAQDRSKKADLEAKRQAKLAAKAERELLLAKESQELQEKYKKPVLKVQSEEKQQPLEGAGENSKPLKCTYTQFSHEEFSKIKAENPTLRRSQIVEIFHKSWKKSPLNPFNQLQLGKEEEETKD